MCHERKLFWRNQTVEVGNVAIQLFDIRFAALFCRHHAVIQVLSVLCLYTVIFTETPPDI